MTFRKYLKAIVPNKGPSRYAILQHWKIYREWMAQIESKKEPLDLEMPWITLLGRDFIAAHLKGKTKDKVKILEYGSGGSSLFFLRFGQVVSVEHNEEWFTKISDYIAKRNVKGW